MLFFFFKVQISLCTLIPLFRPESVHSGSVSWDDCGWVIPDKLPYKLVCWQVPILCLDSGIVSQIWLHWVKSVCVFRWNLPPALLAEWPGSFTCYFSNMEVDRQRIRVSAQSQLWIKKILPLSCHPSTNTNFCIAAEFCILSQYKFLFRRMWSSQRQCFRGVSLFHNPLGFTVSYTLGFAVSLQNKFHCFTKELGSVVQYTLGFTFFITH